MSALVVHCLEQIEDLGASALDAICAEHPDSAAELRKRVLPLIGAGLVEGRAEFPEFLGEFRLIEKLGSGGMGVVYRAEQTSLGREVALKVVRPDQLYFPEARERFRREGAIVARLQHPGIVPVFAFGEELGVPYFAMECVSGCTLADVLDALKDRSPATLTGKDLSEVVRSRSAPLVSEDGIDADRGRRDAVPTGSWTGRWSDVCLSIVYAVAAAVDYAHENGVLHRDVKPSNVMLTADGRVRLLDFGLSSGNTASKLTHTGAMLGSLPYMAPEQVAGKPVDRRTDVYALGLLLFELLTLRTRFPNELGVVELRQRILAGEQVSLRKFHANAPSDAQVVCATAMDIDPERRYATAAAFARDILNVLEKRPIHARPASVWTHVRRWSRRRPATATAAALGTLIVIGGPLGFAIQQRAAAHRIKTALGEAEIERARAVANLEQAIDVVLGLVADVGQNDLDGVPGMSEAQSRVLERSLVALDELLPQGPADPQTLRQRARILHESANALALTNRLDEALDRYAQAERALVELGDIGADPPIEWDLAAVCGNRARTLETLGRYEEARRDTQRAIQLFARARSSRGDNTKLLIATSKAHASMASLLQRDDRYEEARDSLDSALRICDSTPDDRAGPNDVVLQRGSILGTLAAVETQRGAENTGARYGRMCEETVRGFLKHFPSDLQARETLLTLYANLCTVNCSERGPAENERYARAGLELMRDLNREFPASGHSSNESQLVAGLVSSLLSLGRGEEAEDIIATRVADRRELVRKQPSEGARNELASALNVLAVILERQGRTEEAYGAQVEGLDIARELFESHPRWSSVYIHSELRCAALQLARGSAIELDRIESLVQTHAPRSPRRQLQLAGLCSVASQPELEPRPELQTALRERAMAFVERAIALGYRDSDELAGWDALEPLRSLPRWAEVVHSLGAAK